MAAESYVRVRVAESDDAISVQRALSDIAGYIGSFIVELESNDADFPFDIIVGFNGETSDDVDAAVAEAGSTQGVVAVRDFRNRSQVPPSIGGPQP